jgi:hypothetical protein
MFEFVKKIARSESFEPILRLLNLRVVNYNYNASVVVPRLERFFLREENIFVRKTHKATHGIVNFHNAGVVTYGRRIGSRLCMRKKFARQNY